MTHEQKLRRSFRGLEAKEDFSEAVIVMQDGSSLRFCHRVGERWARADGMGGAGSLADQVLATVATFRLNGKHLDVRFDDGSRWEARFR